MAPGANPADVLPTAARAASALVFVETKDVDIVGGAAFVQLRVTVADSSQREEDDDARAALAAVRAGVEPLAQTGRAYILRRWPKGRWVPIPL